MLLHGDEVERGGRLPAAAGAAAGLPLVGVAGMVAPPPAIPVAAEPLPPPSADAIAQPPADDTDDSQAQPPSTHRSVPATAATISYDEQEQDDDEGADALAPLAPLRRKSSRALLGQAADAADNSEADEDVLRSRRGSVLGRRGSVETLRRRALELDEKAQREPTLGEKLEAVEAAAGLEQGGKIVVYTSSMQAVAATYNACVAMRKILQRLRVPFEERDIMMCSKFTEELRSRLDQPISPGGSGPDIALPRLFFNGQHLGGLAEIDEMNETGELAELVGGMERIADNESGECGRCGGQRFYMCTYCGGDKKAITSRLGREMVVLTCTACNENGLMRCTQCMTSEHI